MESAFMPFGSTNLEEKNVIFKGDWALYGYGKQKSNNNCESMLDKYKPKSADDIFGNKKNINNLKSWIKRKMDSKSSKFDYVLITGDTGSGKSEFVLVVSIMKNHIEKYYFRHTLWEWGQEAEGWLFDILMCIGMSKSNF